MIWWLLPALASNPCQDLPDLAEDAGRPPDAWPTYDGRCLDQGSKRETLLERARRCVVEEPEDSAPITLLGYLGDAGDVPVLEALAHRKLNDHPAIESLARLDPTVARPALVRVACHSRHPGPALQKLAEAPRPEEWRLYAQAIHGADGIAIALGRLGLPQTRDVLVSHLRRGPGGSALPGLAADHSPEGVQTYLDLRSDPDLHASIVASIPTDHPAFDQVLEEAATGTPEVRAARVERADDLDDVAADALLRRALDDEDPLVRARAASWLARESGRLPDLAPIAADLADPERAVAYHERRVRSDRDSVEALLRLRDIPETRWGATTALLQAADVVPEEERRALAEWVQTQDDAPRRLQSAARHTLDPPTRPEEGERERELLDLSGVHPTFSRARTPVRDHKRWAKRARAALDDDDESNDAFGLAILPWVGDDTDIDRLAGTSRRGPRTRPLADLGTDAALDRMATSTRGLAWGWSRSERGWSELVASATDPWSLSGIVRPEVYAIVQSEQERHRRRPDEDRNDETVREQREALHHRFRSVPQLPTTASLAATEERGMPQYARHLGHRWIVLAALPDLPEPQRTAALEALVEADWYGERPPEVVVEAARQSTTRGGWRMRIGLGDAEAALEAMKGRGPAANGARQAVVDVLSSPHPPAELLAPVVAWIQSGEVPVMSIGHLLKAPPLRPVVRETLLAGKLDLRSPCDALRWIEDDGGLDMGDVWIVDTLMRCGRHIPSLRLEREHMVALQQQMLARDLDHDQLRLALSLDQSDAEVVRPYLDVDDPMVRTTVAGTLAKAGIPDGEKDRVVAWAREEQASNQPRGFGGGAMDVLLKHAPEEALPLLAARVAEHDDWHAAVSLHRIGTDEAFAAMIPTLQRGTDRKLEQIARWVKDHGGPVYEEHRALVDGIVTPSWKRTP